MAAVVMVLGMPGVVLGMTADGAMITNYAAATSYFGMAGGGVRYTVSYAMTAGVIISCPVVRIQKTVTPTLLSTSQTATFTICAVNNSLQASAFGLVINDRLPDNVGYVKPSMATWAPAGSTLTPAHSSDNATWAAAMPEPANGPPNGQGGPWYLRWAIDKLGPSRSACVSFQVTVL